MSHTISASQKLESLRNLMKEEGIQGYLIPRADEYLGEFVAPYAERLEYISGFTGSAGLCLVLEKEALALTDARYTLQIAGQVDKDLFITGDYIQTPVSQWITEHTPKGAKIGYDPHLHTGAQIVSWQDKLKSHSIDLVPIEYNLIDKIWSDQPEKPKGEIVLFNDALAGLTYSDKIDLICDEIKNSQSTLILTTPDSINWLLNIRGHDIDYIPQALVTALLDCQSRKLTLYADAAKITNAVREALSDRVEFKNPEEMEADIKALSGEVLLDLKRSPIVYKNLVTENNQATLIDAKDPCILPKAQKTASEQQAIKDTHIADGAALVAFMHWLDKATKKKGAYNEYEIALKLKEFRAEHEAFKGNSFPTICGFGSNGAIVHYRATKDKHAPIGKNNLLLIDSGGQYYCDEFAGTTDITRTLLVGKASAAMKKHFTLVLKGHIALASAKFPLGTTGAQLDVLARHALWANNEDFAHGTGHGVGCYLAVHEEAAGISMRGHDALQPGMLLSNEPGYYEEGAYGIRTENLVLVRELGYNHSTGQPMLGFETVSFAPIETDLIDVKLMSKEERNWLNDYHAQTYKKIAPCLERDERAWLKKKTAKI